MNVGNRVPVGNLPGDWRSGAHGANRTAHLFVWGPWGGTKRPACGIRATDSYGPHKTKSREACRDCVAFDRLSRLEA